LRTGEYIEAALIHNQQVSGWNFREVEKAINENKIAIKDIEPNGAHFIHALKPDANILFVLPPSYKEWQRRLQSRGQMEAEEYKRRMESAFKEYKMALNNDYFKFVIHDSLEHSVVQVKKIVQQGVVDSKLQESARALTESLLADTLAFLAKH
jgi:guanylate kinase